MSYLHLSFQLHKNHFYEDLSGKEFDTVFRMSFTILGNVGASIDYSKSISTAVSLTWTDWKKTPLPFIVTSGDL